MGGIVEINIDDLMLDLSNPRFEHLKSQKDALEKIIVSQGKKITNLADDIVTQGLSPAHRMIVMPSIPNNGKYIVLDGNRRLTCLRILSNPASLDGMIEIGDTTKKQLKALSDKFDRSTIEPIDAYSCDDEQEARHWIEAIHTGENDGRGVVGWDGVATARYRGKSSSLRILDLIKIHGGLDEKQTKSLEGFYITNLDRILGTPEVREKLGIELEAGELSSDLPLGELVRPFKRIVTDIASKAISVSHIKSKAERLTYVDGLGRDLPDLSKRTGQMQSIEHLINSKKVLTVSPGKNKNTKTKANRKSLIPPDCHLVINNAKLDEIYHELRKLPLETYPNAIAALARMFIELTLDHFGKKQITGWSNDNKLKAKVNGVADELQNSHGFHKRDLQSFRRLASSMDGGLSIDRLHGAIHSSYTLPTSAELRKGWDEIQNVFEHIWT